MLAPPAFSPLLSSIISRTGFPVLAAGDVASFTAAHENTVLFFAGDAERLAESDDVAVVLPELIAAFRGRIVGAVVRREDERVLQRTYRFAAFPSLVFLRRGEYLGAISRIRDWSDYLEEISEILTREPSEPPPFKLPDPVASAARHRDPELDPDHDHHGHDHH